VGGVPSTRTRPVAALAVAVVLAYALVVAAQILLGAIAAALLGTLVLFADRIARDLDRRRRLVVALLAVGLFGGVTVAAASPLPGLIAASLLALGAWLLAPRGPIARLVRWLRDARDDLRAIRAATVDGESPERD
jgi:MFS family permease